MRWPTTRRERGVLQPRALQLARTPRNCCFRVFGVWWCGIGLHHHHTKHTITATTNTHTQRNNRTTASHFAPFAESHQVPRDLRRAEPAVFGPAEDDPEGAARARRERRRRDRHRRVARHAASFYMSDDSLQTHAGRRPSTAASRSASKTWPRTATGGSARRPRPTRSSPWASSWPRARSSTPWIKMERASSTRASATTR